MVLDGHKGQEKEKLVRKFEVVSDSSLWPITPGTGAVVLSRSSRWFSPTSFNVKARLLVHYVIGADVYSSFK